MATCPACGVNSRDPSVPLTLAKILEVKPLGTFSLAGSQMKASAREATVLACRCGWSVEGELRADGFYADMGTQVWPDDPAGPTGVHEQP